MNGRLSLRFQGALAIANDTPCGLGTGVWTRGPARVPTSGGCCDGSMPMCYARGDFVVGDHDRLLGHIGGMPFFISASQFEFWQHAQLTIDEVPGHGDMFLLEGPLGPRFLVRSRLYENGEWGWLVADGRVLDG